MNTSGSRPKTGGSERELFSEDTETVLIFEDGAVIRLLATVTPGQLIFLTNLTTKQEVVCQVLRKRLLRPAGCYVELQFTEQKKGFWGSPEAGGAGLTAGGTAKKVASKEPVNAEPAKRSMETLVSEVQELLAKRAVPLAQGPVPGTRAAASEELNPGAAGPARSVSHETVEAASHEEDKKAASPKSNDALDDLLPKPELDFSQVPEVVEAKKHDPSLLQKPIPEIGAGTRKLAWAAVLLIALGAGARYGHWMDFLKQQKATGPGPAQKTESGTAARPASSVTKQAVTKEAEEKPAAKSSGAAPASVPETNAAAEKPATGEKARSGNPEQPPVPVSDAASEKPKDTAPHRAAGQRGKSETSATVETEMPGKEAEPPGEGTLMPAKLVKSVNPVYPPEAMKNFITGDVRAEVVVEPTGRVGEVRVASGPNQLRAAAVEALKQYEFSPATRGGKALSSKAMVTVKFWFNP